GPEDAGLQVDGAVLDVQQVRVPVEVRQTSINLMLRERDHRFEPGSRLRQPGMLDEGQSGRVVSHPRGLLLHRPDRQSGVPHYPGQSGIGSPPAAIPGVPASLVGVPDVMAEPRDEAFRVAEVGLVKTGTRPYAGVDTDLDRRLQYRGVQIALGHVLR